MRTRLKNSVKHFGLTFLVLFAAIFWVAGCATPTPDPLAGGNWKTDFHEQPSQAIEKDYHDFIQKLQSEGMGQAQATGFLEDGTGQHAVSIEIFIKGENASWQYVLIYDKDDKRIKAIKYGFGRYQS